jgi:hypothetical protein
VVVQLDSLTVDPNQAGFQVVPKFERGVAGTELVNALRTSDSSFGQTISPSRTATPQHQ